MIFPVVGDIFGGALTWAGEFQVVLKTVLGLLALFVVLNMGLGWLGAKAAAAGKRKR